MVIKSECPYLAGRKKCTHARRFRYYDRTTSSTKTPICPFNNVARCPEYKKWKEGSKE